MVDFAHLVGRDAQRREVEQLLSGLPHTGGALAWAAEPGHGKSAALDAARSSAARAGVRTITIEGGTVAGRQDGLLHAVQARLGTVPTPSGGTSDRPLHRLLRELVESAAHGGPVLLCMDDADLLAAADIATLTFTGRRLGTVPVLLLVTAGPSMLPLLERSGMPVESLRPLTDEEAGKVLPREHPDLDREVATRIIGLAAGSPLPLLELPRALTSRQRRGLEPPPGVLPLTERLRRLYGDPLRRLTGPARTVVTAAALGGSEVVPSLLAAGDPGLDAEAVDELERAGILAAHDDAGPLAFRLPLTRNAVLESVTEAELVRGRHLLAAAFRGEPDRQALQLADLSGGPDAALADRLERGARRAAERGDLDEAVTGMVRAAHLTPERSTAGRRLLEAAHLRATVTGEMDAASDALAQASRADADTVLNVRAAATSGQLMMAAGAPLGEVYRVLVEALRADARKPADDEPATVAALQLLFYVCLMLARPAPWAVYRDLAERHQSVGGSIVGLLGEVLPDISATTPETLTRLDAAVAGLTDVVNPAEVVGVGIAAYHLDRLADCRAALLRVVDDARRGHSVGMGSEASLRLALDDCHTGQLAEATRLATGGLNRSSAIGGQSQTWTFQLCLALVAAIRGDQAEVDALTAQLSDWAASRGARLVDLHCAQVRGLAALGRGDFEAAYSHATSVNPPGTLARDTPIGVASSLDLVEAAMHTGRVAQAQAHAAAMTDAGLARLSPRLAVRVAAASAMTAPDTRARHLFEAALATPNAGRWPFDRARVQLAFGDRLRRLHATREAQPHLSAAYETFRRLGAQGWAHRAAQEMRAAGLPMPADRRPPPTALVGRDLEIASLAAAGLSNQEIGATLFLSPRTVGSRLYRIYPRLGVSSRAGLRDALEQPAGQDA
jgi:DNA-binding CsgD family transcriptional regulator